MVTKSLDAKLKAIHADPHHCQEFILADAKDADMAFGIGAPGLSPESHSGELRFRSLAEYRRHIRQNIRQAMVDIVLMSASTNYQLTIEERLFDQSPVTPAIRANDTTDIHLARGGHYAESPSRPHRSAMIDHAQCGHVDCAPEERTKGANLGLYSVTFNNDLDHDLKILESFHEFREEAERKGFHYFLEVFDPNVPGVIDADDLPKYINDMIVRMLGGVAGPGRPLFLKIVYHGPKALEELIHYDPHLVVGILGGSAGTTLDAFQLLHDSKKYGAKVALYGRKINNAENQLAFIHFLRLIADGQLDPKEAVKAYHAVLEQLGTRPHRSLEDDLVLQSTAMSYAGRSSAASVPPPSEPTPSSNGHGAVLTSSGGSTNGSVVGHPRMSMSTNGRLTTPLSQQSSQHAQATPSENNGFPVSSDGYPDFTRMTVEQRLEYHRQRLGLGSS